MKNHCSKIACWWSIFYQNNVILTRQWKKYIYEVSSSSFTFTPSTHNDFKTNPMVVNSLAPGICGCNLKLCHFETHIKDCWALTVKLLKLFSNVKRSHLLLINIGSGNGLEPSGNKPVPEPMLIQTYVTSPYGVIMHNELTYLGMHLFTELHIRFLLKMKAESSASLTVD